MLEFRNELILLITAISSFIISAKSHDCYRLESLVNSSDKEILVDVMQSPRKPRKDKTIFIHITNCMNNGEIYINSRQACAVESAALLNPSLDVFVLFTSPVFVPKTNSSKIIRFLLSYHNVFIRNNNIWMYTENTIAEDWIRSEELFSSKFMYSHLSDFLRYMTLWRFGGIFIDTDTVVMKSLENLSLNFAGFQDEQYIGSAIMGFSNRGFGHSIVENCLFTFMDNFNGDSWFSNGPWVIQKTLTNYVCRGPLVPRINNCSGFTIYEPEKLFPFCYSQWRYYFDENQLNFVMNKTKNSFIIHLWNKLSGEVKIKKGSKCAYGVLAEKYCPNAYGSAEQYF